MDFIKKIVIFSLIFCLFNTKIQISAGGLNGFRMSAQSTTAQATDYGDWNNFPANSVTGVPNGDYPCIQLLKDQPGSTFEDIFVLDTSGQSSVEDSCKVKDDWYWICLEQCNQPFKPFITCAGWQCPLYQANCPAGTVGASVIKKYGGKGKAGSAGGHQGAKINTSDYIGLITMLAAAIVATALVKNCKIGANYEVYLFAAGALTYITSEILANFQYKEQNNTLVAYNASATLTASQRQAFVDLKKSYQDIKSTAKTKMILQLAAAAAFTGAAAIATVKWFKEKAALKSCNTAITQAQTNLKSEAIPKTSSSPSCSGFSINCGQALGQSVGVQGNIEAVKNGTTPSLSSTAKVTKLAKEQHAKIQSSCLQCPTTLNIYKQGCSEKQLTDISNGVACQTASMAGTPAKRLMHLMLAGNVTGQDVDNFVYADNQKMNPDVFTQAMNLLIAKAHAESWEKYLGIGAVGLGVIAGLMLAKTALVDSFIAYPGRRAIVFGIFAALAVTTAMLTNNIAKKADDEIKKIDDILNQFDTHKTQAETATTTYNNTLYDFATVAFSSRMPAAKELALAEFKLSEREPLPCLMPGTKSGSCQSITSSAAGARKSGKLTQTQVNVERKLAVLTNSIFQGVDALQGRATLSAAAQSHFINAAKQLTTAQKILTDTRETLNATLRANGSQPVNISEEETKLFMQMNTETQNTLKAKGIQPAQALASGMFGQSYKSMATVANANKKALNQTTDNGISGEEPNANGEVLTSPEKTSATPNNAAKENSGVFENKDADVNNNADSSIWSSISKRYHQSFLPKLFGGGSSDPSDKKEKK